MENIPSSVTAILITVIIGLLSFIAKRLNDLLTKLILDTDLANKRHDVTDIVISSLLKENYNSKSLARDSGAWPHIFKSSKMEV